MLRKKAHVIIWSVGLVVCMVFITLFGTAAKLTLIPFGIILIMPVMAWWNTGKFTYWPEVQNKPEVPSLRFNKNKERKTNIETTKNAASFKAYDLSDIPYPPKRDKASRLSSLPQGDGLTPSPKMQQVSPQRCAILTRNGLPRTLRDATPALLGTNLELFEEQKTLDDSALDVIIVHEGEVFL